jgi:hypothetical protein
MEMDRLREALRKGQGRAYGILENSDPAPYREVLLDACLHDTRFDRQAEHPRGAYLFGLLRLARMEQEALEVLLATLPTTEDEADGNQMTDLLGAYAVAGSARAETALFARAAGGDARAQDRLAALRPRGLEWLEAHVLPTLDEADAWVVGRWLRETAEPDTHDVQRRLRRFFEASQAREKARSKRSPPASVQEFLRAIRKGKKPQTPVRFFAREATEAQFQEATELFLSGAGGSALRSLRWLFRDRPFPLPLERLFVLARDEARGQDVCQLLGDMNDPRIRELGLSLIAQRPLVRRALDTLRRSFQPGDEVAIAALLPAMRQEDDARKHDVVLSLLDMASHTPGFSGQPFAEWTYEHSPCAFCRSNAVDWMVEHGHLPTAIREEARHDAEAETRELAKR